MPTVVGVRLRFSKTLWFESMGLEPAENDKVIVETERGREIGRVVQTPHEVSDADLPAALKPVLRIANEEDLARAEELAAKEREAMPAFREMVAEHKLDMKPVDVEYLLDGDKIVFYFSSEERVDFRELVKDLATRFRARIDMRQVGVRDEARSVGGVGHCGQMLCCVRFGGEFQPVSIRMAKEQDLPLNPLKISGLCGRLMCCLRYEFDAYKDFKSRAPKRGAIIDTPLGLAKITDMSTPREAITMRFEDGKTATVPLASMGCSKGTGCPCTVSLEALQEAGSQQAIAALEAAAAPPVVERQLETASVEPGERAGGGRRRRRRKPGQGGTQQPAEAGKAQGGEQPKAKQARAEQPKAKPKPKPPKPAGEAATPAEGQPSGDNAVRPRRRRRRRPGGGSGNKDA